MVDSRVLVGVNESKLQVREMKGESNIFNSRIMFVRYEVAGFLAVPYEFSCHMLE